MMLLLSGEGPSDIGTCRGMLPPCEGSHFVPGPMAVLVDQMAERQIGYSMLDVGAVRFIDEHTVTVHTKLLSRQRSPRLPGAKKVRGTVYHQKNAQALGYIAKGLEAERQMPVVCVLFHDTDGSNSDPATLCEDKFYSIVAGFADAEFERGVPMVPKPKSEAWLLGGLRESPYHDCTAIEDESGNDKSPNSLKKQLHDAFGFHPSSEQLADMLREGRIDIVRISSMHSFQLFKKELVRALNSALAH